MPPCLVTGCTELFLIPAHDQLRLFWTSNRHPAALNPGSFPLDDQNFPQLQGNTMAAARAHGFEAIRHRKVFTYGLL